MVSAVPDFSEQPYVWVFQCKDLRLRHYQGLQPVRGWPSQNAYGKYGTFSWWIKWAKEYLLDEAEQAAA